mmetsp:Transcript_17705/g.55810  ORF Transcript_17705/g.55810 Transcript_17705/m.55810 type:complete len:242 (-) Transcript_17705:37-762(-)
MRTVLTTLPRATTSKLTNSATVATGTAPYCTTMLPSGVNAMPESQQAAVVLAIFAGLALDTWGLLFLFGKLRGALPEGWFANWQKTWPLVGAVYMAAGVAHFTAAAAFESIYPPAGTWGFWYLPGSAEFHVAWTGVAELAGGAGLFLGAVILGLAGNFGWEVPPVLRQLHALSALGLFALTLAISPANIYMYTHGAQMVGLTPGDAPIPVEGHYARAALQAVLLSILWEYYQYARPKTAEE